MKLFLVFQWKDQKQMPEFQGVFSCKEKAEVLCKTRSWCVCPSVLDKPLPDATTAWHDAYFPVEV